MKRFALILLIIFTAFIANAGISFDDYFLNKSMRLDYIHTGNKSMEVFSFDELREEPYWGGSKVNLIDIFDYGKYKFEVYDAASNTLIYSHTYSTLFAEWQTTEEAKTVTRSLSETAVFPYPLKKVNVVFYSRDKKNLFQKVWEYPIDPASIYVSKEKRFVYPSFDVLKNGDPAVKVDLVIIPDGYTKDEMELFKKDCEKFSKYLFNAEPFKSNKKKFNIYGVEAPSQESGPDVPGENVWKNTILNTTFYALGTDRYLMTYDDKSVRNIAANAPYDQIYILVNSNKYGGGSIYNYYSVCVNSNYAEEYVFQHEFGHGFAGLGDEYYTSEVAVENFYPVELEPWEPNLTTLVNFDAKWKSLVDKQTPVPTPAESQYSSKIGVFEGGGYNAKGIYRPALDCTMKSIIKNKFCRVCQNSIQKSIDFYSK
ncbi:MAG: M64 family metallopeptidase [Bacteroidota bacterium]